MASFNDLFPVKKPVIGMIHLAGVNPLERVRRALDELIIYQERGLDGAIVEDYHGDEHDLESVLREIREIDLQIPMGINLLRFPHLSFRYAQEYGAKFVQIDSVQTKDLSVSHTMYNAIREPFPNILVLGGVGFKYTLPSGNPLEQDLAEGKTRCEAIVTTGSGTGVETPLQKLVEFKKYLGDFPLLVGAGLTAENAYEQLRVVDGAIVGSYLKDGNTRAKVIPERCSTLMDSIKRLRSEDVAHS